MPAVVSHHRVHTPRDLQDALRFLAENAGEGWTPLAGGTDVLVALDHGVETRSSWLDLGRLREGLGGIEATDGRFRVGGLATMTDVRRSVLLHGACPLIAEAAATVGALQIQNRATVAGNIVNASPAGDTLPVWLALDADIELASVRGTRRVPYREFMTGYRQTALREDELLTAVEFPRLPGTGWRGLYRKVGTRAAQAISKVVMVGLARSDGRGAYDDVRLAFGSMAPVTVRAQAAEAAALAGAPGETAGEQAAAALTRDLTPIDDVRSTGAYRMRVAQNLVREFVAGRLGHPFG
jgi:CO/xanthine dehydrogenase FAD-binding subunit